ncbi:MAG: hypothetical protein IJ757_08685 [Clostridiales bacterium]|nr:hypothetical protein [Clostridiales bacterium]
MITCCKNCAGKLVYDPKKQMLVCEMCGSLFAPEEVGTRDDGLNADSKARSLNDIYGTDSEDLMDCYVYTCNSCGGEIIINGTEASTKCIYCGNSAVVFSRITRQHRPQGIIPFKITKEEAVEAVRRVFEKGVFIPKQVKQFEADSVRGIYIPYWIVDLMHKGAVVVSGRVGSGKHSKTVYYGRAGRLKLNSLPLDASRMLSDESSARLEPYDLYDLRKFDESFLLGFYSNISDVTYRELWRAASLRADAYFDELAKKSVHDATSKSIHASDQVTAIDYDHIRYALLPAWFITYSYNGRHNTIIVNGQTGKVVCGVPWNKKLFYLLLVALGALLSAAFFLILRQIIPVIFESRSSDSFKAILIMIAGSAVMFSYGISRIRTVINSIKLTQASSIFNFVKKRQG